MHVTVVGAGSIGSTLAAAFSRAGHRVRLGSRSPDPDRGVADVADALVGADVVVLAVPGGAVAGVVSDHAAALAHPLVVDATNRPGGGALHARAEVLAAVPDARYARAFSSLGVEVLREPGFGPHVADLLFSCADDDEGAVADLVRAVGLRPVHLGDDAHDVVDDATRLWFALARRRGRHLALRVLDDQEGA